MWSCKEVLNLGLALVSVNNYWRIVGGPDKVDRLSWRGTEVCAVVDADGVVADGRRHSWYGWRCGIVNADEDTTEARHNRRGWSRSRELGRTIGQTNTMIIYLKLLLYILYFLAMLIKGLLVCNTRQPLQIMFVISLYSRRLNIQIIVYDLWVIVTFKKYSPSAKAIMFTHIS
jgi:hypothetical protein